MWSNDIYLNVFLLDGYFFFIFGILYEGDYLMWGFGMNVILGVKEVVENGG